MDNPLDTIVKVLEIIGYKGDKQKFVNQFIENSQKQAVIDLVDTLPADKQAQLKQQLSTASENQIPDNILQNYFTKDQYLEALTKATKVSFGSFLETIQSSLTESQTENLQAFLAPLAKQSQPQAD